MAEESNFDAETIFNRIFYCDIKDLLNEPDLWTNRLPPTAMKYSLNSSDTFRSVVEREYEIWSENECKQVFKNSIDVIRRELGKSDKKNTENFQGAVIDFITATTNLRASNFLIPHKIRRLEVKRKCRKHEFILSFKLQDKIN